MEIPTFVKWYCTKKEKCSHSTAKTNFYSLKRIRKLNELDPLVPKNSRWVTDGVLGSLKQFSNVTRKNLLGALVAYLRLTKAPAKKIELASEMMYEASGLVDKHYSSQAKTAKQKKNWVDIAKIRQFHKSKTEEIKARGLFSKTDWNAADRKLLTQHLLLAFHGGTDQPPLRLELSNLIYREDGEGPGNSIYKRKRKWFITIKESKTTKSSGPVEIPLRPEVTRIMNKYSKHLSYGDAIFPGKFGKPISKSTYSRRLERLFKEKFPKKRIGAGLVRTIFLTDKYKDIPEDIFETSSDMLHSVATGLKKYRKKG